MVQRGSAPSDPIARLVCPECGMRFLDFSRIGRFGCGQCYTAFRAPLEDLFRKVHGATHHRGRSPETKPRAIPTPIEEEVRLREELRQAIEREDFEVAAELRRSAENCLVAFEPGGTKPGAGMTTGGSRFSSFEDLAKRSVSWLSGDGQHADMVLSSRVRLARNLAKHRYPMRAEPQEAEEVVALVRTAIEKAAKPGAPAGFSNRRRSHAKTATYWSKGI